MRKAIIGSALGLAVVAAGCGGGGGGGGRTLSKAGYIAALNAACTDANKTFSAMGAGNLASFKLHGDEIVAAAKKANAAFHAAKAPDELKAEEAIFDDSADKIVTDMQALTDAAKAGSQSKFDAALQSLQTHGSANDQAAQSIGATDCVGGG